VFTDSEFLCPVQSWVKILVLAFLVVAGSCGLLIPIMLYVLDLQSEGWTWQYVALFGSMCASTDAVAIVATMKTSAPPHPLRGGLPAPLAGANLRFLVICTGAF
jgi:NhaP-type Na+/H+ or K+/H+ antiporter